MLLDDDLLQDFIIEAKEHVEAIEPLLLALEAGEGDETEVLNTLFRAVHSIKGAAGFLGLNRVNDLSHAMESLMSKLRSKEIVFHSSHMAPLLAGVDKLCVMVSDPAESNAVEINKELDALNAIINGEAQAEVASETPVEDTPTTEAKPQPGPKDSTPLKIQENALKEWLALALELGESIYQITVILGQELPEENEHVSGLKKMGKILQEKCIDVDNEQQEYQVVYASILDQDMLCSLMAFDPQQVVFLGPEKAQLEQIAAIKIQKQKDKVQTEKKSKESKQKKNVETIRVSIDLIDRLMNTVGELVLSRNQILKSNRYQKLQGGHALQNLDRLVSELQDSIMHTRLQPIGILFNKFPRIVRDLSRKLGKKVALEVIGSEVELDKSIIEVLSDPLTHLIRNSIDHGIEPIADRLDEGKDSCANITLKAYHNGGEVVIEIHDDGRGIDLELIRQSAVRKGLIDAGEVANLSDLQVIELIFKPGFSTAKEVSNLSGRGVGMDVVRNNINKLGGTIEVKSEWGVGTTSKIVLPLTLAIIPSLLIKLNDKKYAIPQMNIKEMIRINEFERQSLIKTVNNVEVIEMRGKLIPLIYLADMMGVDREIDAELEWNIILISSGNQHYALVVLELLESEEIVVKPLSNYLTDKKIYSGCTILGDGDVAMILDVSGIAQVANIKVQEELNWDEDLSESEEAKLEQVLLFSNHSQETFAFAMSDILRLEQVSLDDIAYVAGREVIVYKDRHVPVIRLENILNIKEPDSPAFRPFILLIKGHEHRGGILINRIIDNVDLLPLDDKELVKLHGIKGQRVLDESLISFIDTTTVVKEL